VRDHLCVRLGPKGDAALLERRLERAIVLYNAIVHQGDRGVAIDVRVAVLFGDGAMGGPARMADAQPSWQVHLSGPRCQVPDPADTAAATDLPTVQHR